MKLKGQVAATVVAGKVVYRSKDLVKPL